MQGSVDPTAFPRTAAVAARLEVLPECGSTNAELRDRMPDAAAWPHLAVLLTRDQTAGRGRLDRRWVAPAGAALAISVLLRELPGPELLGWVPLVAGAAMADAVAAQLPTRDVGVKWPNDVLVDDRKICGILAEAAGGTIILGAGVNTAMAADALPVPTATSFAALGATADEDRLVSEYLRGLRELLEGIRAGGRAQDAVRARVRARCLTIGRTVEVSLPDGRALRGVAADLDDDGRLIVEVDGAAHAVSAGDVVHARLADGGHAGRRTGMSAAPGTMEG